MSTWYYVEGGERRGPIDHGTLTRQLETGALPADTLVWRDGMGDWVPASNTPELAGSREAEVVPEAMAVPAGGYDPYAQEQYGVQYVTYAGFWK